MREGTKSTPFFIVGAGRSGTTLLRLILAGHPHIHIPPETWFIKDLVEQLPLDVPLKEDQVIQAVEIITTAYRWPDMDMGADKLRASATLLKSPKLVDVINLVYSEQLKRWGKPRFGDKTPCYIGILRELNILYPGCKFIHLIRDGRDVAISTMDMSRIRYYDRQEFEWWSAMQYRRAYLNSDLAAQILEVRYENLVLQPEATMRQICDFLGEEFHSEMLDWRDRIDLVPAREQRAHTKLVRPLAADAIGVWQHRLSAWECLAIEACLQHDLKWLGYRLRFSSIGWVPLLTAIRWSLLTAAPLLIRAIPYLQRRHLFPQKIYI